MKKIAMILIVLLLMISFAGCIGEKPTVEEKVVSEEVQKPIEEKTTKVEPPAEEKVVPKEEQKPVEEEVTKVAPAEEDSATQEISSDIAEVKVIEEDFDISDLGDLENDLDAIVW